jgi:hypothetical protein
MKEHMPAIVAETLLTETQLKGQTENKPLH